MDKAPLLRELPSRLLQILLHEITRLNQLIKDVPVGDLTSVLPPRQLDRYSKLLKAFCIIARHPDNVQLLASPGALAVFIELFTHCIRLVTQLPQTATVEGEVRQLIANDINLIFQQSASLIASILDPHKSWAKFLARFVLLYFFS